jgi:sulfite reductase alpha subunit-like flavoprotein
MKIEKNIMTPRIWALHGCRKSKQDIVYEQKLARKMMSW